MRLLILGCFMALLQNPVIKLQAQCNPVRDSLQLVALYNATKGPSWDDHDNWLVPGKPISSWNGIEIDTMGCVSIIWLDGNHLSGNIPVLDLPNLQTLNLGHNLLSGTIPDFKLLPMLKDLALFYNELTGEIPDFKLPNLVNLELEVNLLQGAIPNFNLPNLEWLSLNGCQLVDTIPNFKLPQLQALFLGGNQLVGSIPNFNLPRLKTLGLSDNQLKGSIPDFKLPNLETLQLYENELSGSIPASLGNMAKLDYLSLQNNQLTGCLPMALQNLCPTLIFADISNNPDLATQSWANFCTNQEGMCTSAVSEMGGGDMALSIFPNPAQLGCQIECRALPLGQTLHYDLLNANGQLCRRATTASANFWLEREGLPPGMYLLRLSDATGKVLDRQKVFFAD